MPQPAIPGQSDAPPTHVFVVIRLVVDRHRQVKYGEVVDGGTRSWGRFCDWGGLIRGMQAYIAHLPGEDTPDP